MTQEYSKYFIDVSDYTKIDIYRYLELLEGERGHAIEHALKKLALCGVRTGGKDMRKDIKEARDTLTRWLDMRDEDDAIAKAKEEKIRADGVMALQTFMKKEVKPSEAPPMPPLPVPAPPILPR